MHPSKQRVEGIVVVVQLDAGLAGKGARHPADVLHDPAAARDRKCQEQRVERREVEALAEVSAGGEQQGRAVSSAQPVEDSPTKFLASSTLKHRRLDAVARAQLGSEDLEVSGARSLALDPASVAALRTHHKRQLEERIAWGAAWTGVEADLVFTKEDGGPIHPERLSRYFDARVAKTGLPRITFHGLRHSYVTMLQMSDVAATASFGMVRDQGPIRVLGFSACGTGQGPRGDIAAQADHPPLEPHQLQHCVT